MRTSALVHWFSWLAGDIDVHDIAVGEPLFVNTLFGCIALLPGIRRPMALGFRTDEIRRMLTIEVES